jgi:endonuclease III
MMDKVQFGQLDHDKKLTFLFEAVLTTQTKVRELDGVVQQLVQRVNDLESAAKTRA